MEARALGGGPSNMLPQAGVGRFMGAPRTAMFLSCRDRASSAVVNAPNPVRMNNLTFMWEAPYQDVGDIYFMYDSLNQTDIVLKHSRCSLLSILLHRTRRASVLLGDRYWIFTSERLLSNPFRKCAITLFVANMSNLARSRNSWRIGGMRDSADVRPPVRLLPGQSHLHARRGRVRAHHRNRPGSPRSPNHIGRLHPHSSG